MKLNKISYYAIYFFTGILLVSCNRDDPQQLVRKAQDSLVANKPQVALDILSSISDPSSLDKDSHMRYIVTYVGAKYESGKDIKQNVIILGAQEYFNKNGISRESVLANYYASQFHDLKGNYPEALESYMRTAYEAGKLGDNLLAGKSLNNIGYIYFEQDVMDSAIISYKKALSYYNKVKNTESQKLKTFTNIGRAYDAMASYDIAIVYYDECFLLAKETKNELYQFYSLKNMGVAYYGKKEYDKAIKYYQLALTIAKDEKEIPKIHTSLLNTCNQKHDLALAKQYADQVIADLPGVTDKYTIKAIYAALAEYYRQSGDNEQALNYTQQEKETADQILKDNDSPALLAASKNFDLSQQSWEKQVFRMKMYMIGGLVVVCLLITLGFVIWLRISNKKFQAELDEYRDQLDTIRQQFSIPDEEYDRIEAELRALTQNDDDEKKE